MKSLLLTKIPVGVRVLFIVTVLLIGYLAAGLLPANIGGVGRSLVLAAIGVVYAIAFVAVYRVIQDRRQG